MSTPFQSVITFTIKKEALKRATPNEERRVSTPKRRQRAHASSMKGRAVPKMRAR